MAHTTALRRIFLLALAFVPSSAFIASPTVRAPQLAGHCPKSLPRPAAPARFGQPKMVRIASGGERDAIEDAVRIFKDAVRAKEAGDLDEAAALYTNATDLMELAVFGDAPEVAYIIRRGRVLGEKRYRLLVDTPTRPRGRYVEAITFAIFYSIIYVGTTAFFTLVPFQLYSELSVGDTNIRKATIIGWVALTIRLSPLWLETERLMYLMYDIYAISFLDARYTREDKE